MADTFFQIAAPELRRVRIALAPVHNLLNSMALLNLAEAEPAISSWVRSTAAALTPAERHANQLIFASFSATLIANAGEDDFESFLEALTKQHPEALRDQAREELDHMPFANSALRAEVEALLSDPFRMHDVLVTHLRALWERSFAAEWARIQRPLANQVRTLQNSVPNLGNTPAIIAEKLQTLIARPAGADGADEIVFVPSAHTGRHTTELRFGGTQWLFFDAQLNFSALLRDSAVGQLELLGRLNALADSMRLRVLQLVARHDELTIPEIMDQLQISQPNASRYLKSLSVYLAERRGKDGKKYYRLIPGQLELTFQALRQTLFEAQPAAQEPPALQEGQSTGLSRWLDAQGTLTAWPARERDRLVVLEYIAGFFEADTTYGEKEVNAIIATHVFQYVRDHVTLRRDLVDYEFLRRAADGSRYWRNMERPAVSATEP